jgi:iron(III) transport system permease protein
MRLTGHPAAGREAAVVPRLRSGRVGGLSKRLPPVVLLIAVAVLVLGPLITLEGRATANGGRGFSELIHYPGIWTVLANTLELGVGATAVALVLGVGLAWCVSRLDGKLEKVGSVLPLLPLMMPAVAGTMGWIFLFAPTAGYLNQALRALPWMNHSSLSGPVNIYSMYWIILLTGLNLTGFVFMYVYSTLRSMGGGPAEAAAICGASAARIFRTVTLPLLRPAIAYSAGIVFLMSLGQFTNPLLLGATAHVNVLTTVLFQTTSNYPVDYSLGAAIASPLLFFGLITMLVQQRSVGSGSRYVVVTGKNTYRQVRANRLAVIPVLVFVVVAVLLPLAALILVSFSPFWSGTAIFTHLTTANVHTVIADPRVAAAIHTTFETFALTLVIVIPIGFLIALILGRSVRNVDGVTRNLLDIFCTLPLAMPAALVGFAALYTYTSGPLRLYGTNTIIVLTFLTLMLPHAVRPQLAAMHGISREFAEASRVSGASGLRTLALIQFPLIRRGVMVACAIVTIMLFHEFAASLLVVGGSKQTLGTLLYSYYSDGVYPEVAVLALIMTAITTIGVTVTFVFGGARMLGR